MKKLSLVILLIGSLLAGTNAAFAAGLLSMPFIMSLHFCASVTRAVEGATNSLRRPLASLDPCLVALLALLVQVRRCLSARPVV